MVAPIVNTKIFKPFMPSLFHLALVKVSLPFTYEYDSEMLSEIIEGIHYQNSTASKADTDKYPKGSYSQAKEKLLFIPAHLRERVVATVHGMKFEFSIWQLHHAFIKGMFRSSISLYKDILYWRSDGSIDTIKTAKEMVLNEKFHIRNRFQIACVYCFVNNVQEIWAAMEASGIAENDYLRWRTAEDFWIKWMRNGTRVHWIDALLEENFVPVRLSSFFPLLQPETRQKFLPYITYRDSISGNREDDIRQCLNAMTKEEEEELIRINAVGVFFSFLSWPFNTLFVEIGRKMLNFMSYLETAVALCLICSRRFKKDSDYRKLFDDFWNVCPGEFKAKWREVPFYAKKFGDYFEEKRVSQRQSKMAR